MAATVDIAGGIWFGYKQSHDRPASEGKAQMEFKSFYYNCTVEYIATIDPHLEDEVGSIIRMLPRRDSPELIKEDLFWLFTHKGWCYDTIPAEANPECPFELDFMESLEVLRDRNLRELCLTSSNLETRWHADFAKRYGSRLVQVETQLGKAESMFKDFCGFRIAHAEGRLALGIEIVMVDPPGHRPQHMKTTDNLASFDIAQKTLTTIGLDSPIWLLGMVA